MKRRRAFFSPGVVWSAVGGRLVGRGTHGAQGTDGGGGGGGPLVSVGVGEGGAGGVAEAVGVGVLVGGVALGVPSLVAVAVTCGTAPGSR